MPLVVGAGPSGGVVRQPSQASPLPPPPTPPGGAWVLFSPDQWRYVAQLGQWFAAAYQAALLAQLGLSAQLNAFQGGAMSSFDDLSNAVSRLNNDVGSVKASIDQAVTLLGGLGGLQPAQQQQLDQAVAQLTTASDTLESAQTDLSGAETPPAAPAPAPATPTATPTPTPTATPNPTPAPPPA